MNTRTLAIGVGAAFTTFLLVGAGTIELLGAGEAPGIGILGVFAGIVAGLLAGIVVTVTADRLTGLRHSLLVGYAAFGAAFIAVFAMRYVNVPGADDVFTFPVHVGVSLLAAVVLAVGDWQGGRPDRAVRS